ncbi:MarR family transcriptional regulator, partial [Peribacillus frigoritolerans]|uniref:MarR family transcriptional regulator n=1 Tax=Peribacillus frigoritolerans TaxID=450367 RepID=UPI0020BDA965
MAYVLVPKTVSQIELEEHLTITRGGVSNMLTRLEKENLIVRNQQWKVKYIAGTDVVMKVVKIVM